MLLGNVLKRAGGWGFCKATANALAFPMDLLADDSKAVLKITGKVILYQRRDHRVSLGYSPCSTSNVQVLGRCTRPALHAMPCLSIGVVFCLWLICCQVVPMESCCNQSSLLVINMLIFWG